MNRKCTCIRCKAEDFVRSIYPKLDDETVLAVATKIVSALHGRKAIDSHVGPSRKPPEGE